MSTFMNLFEELNHLYESDEVLADEAEIVAPEEDAAPAQRVLACASCGALVIKDEADVVIDEESDLANVEEKCAACEKTEGFEVLGEFIPFAADAAEEADAEEEIIDEEEAEEDADEALDEGVFDGLFGRKRDNRPDRSLPIKGYDDYATEPMRTPDGVEVSDDDYAPGTLPMKGYYDYENGDVLVEGVLIEGKIADLLKKAATRVGADAATVLRCFGELSGNDAAYDLTSYIENKAVLKALQSGNEKVFNTMTQDDIDDLVRDIAEYERDAAHRKDSKGKEFFVLVSKTEWDDGKPTYDAEAYAETEAALQKYRKAHLSHEADENIQIVSAKEAKKLTGEDVTRYTDKFVDENGEKADLDEGLFGIKTKKEKEAEAARKAEEERKRKEEEEARK